MKIPDDMRTRDIFGFSGEGTVDGRYMPPEAVGPGDYIELTDCSQVVKKAVADAKMSDVPWPAVQFLWECHPIHEWFADSTSGFFAGHSAPVASLKGTLKAGETAVILHGAIPNQNGAPVVERWAVMVEGEDGSLHIEEINDFLIRTRLRHKTPNHAIDDFSAASAMVQRAVDAFQTHLVELRKKRAKEIDNDLTKIVASLADLEARFWNQLSLRLGPSVDENQVTHMRHKRSALKRKRAEQRIEQIFDDCNTWFERTRQMADDPNPHVDILAVFTG